MLGNISCILQLIFRISNLFFSIVAPYGVKLRTMNYADIASGMNWNETINRTFDIKATPTVVVSNTKTGKHLNLVGREDINYDLNP